MQYFIGINGKVYADNRHNRKIQRLNIENNLFDDKEEAHYASHLLEDYQPMIFYGKPRHKTGISSLS